MRGIGKQKTSLVLRSKTSFVPEEGREYKRRDLFYINLNSAAVAMTVNQNNL